MNEQTKKRLFVGKVVSNKMEKTVVVTVVRRFKHPVFGKVVKQDKRYKVHNPKDEAQLGDTVEFYEGAPLSKTKHMYLSRVVTKQTV